MDAPILGQVPIKQKQEQTGRREVEKCLSSLWTACRSEWQRDDGLKSLALGSCKALQKNIGLPYAKD